ncbi:hypothetical protein CGRA01v4_06509 [Colletotrichum graminicola]|uniref:YMC020W-like alpha/beta hydrolase domain-containing protein n=1 Tax=Colletotrichum graminicola (strain M1.001 / M2 / FGSC 10212) TaxID=645133 RepID=E3Q252_COLGM|nr:uncharacterized protein GLRG_00297 [Colletotrichum graminicola M1.001]EFQ25153.1 hypothetical protein GLRG_00297 [Colletotrichum graminicola M1.001]WDK15228.1 hypothetical protein CGRA01v4_06509 [Colletotrichum graminicola]
MSPRKRQRTAPSNPSSSSPLTAIAPAIATSATSQVTAVAVSEPTNRPTRQMPLIRDRSGSETKNTPQNSQKQVRKARSWYGSWPRVPKSSASTQLARETIFGGTPKPLSTPDFRRFDTKKSTDSTSFDGPADSSTSLPQIPENGAVMTRDNITNTKTDSDTIAVEDTDSNPSHITKGTPTSTDDTAKPNEEHQTAQQTAATAGWFGWLARAPVTETQAFTPVEEQPKEVAPSKEPEVQAEVQAVSVDEPPAPETHEEQPGPNLQASTNSWFGFWYSNPPKTEAPPKDATVKAASVIEGAGATEPPAKEPEDVVMDDAPPPPKPEPAKQPTAGSTWAFWSRETRPKAEGTKTASAQPESGELAVIGQGSEAHPEHTGLKVNQNQSDGSVKDGKTAKSSNDAKSSKTTISGMVSAPSTLGRKSKRTRPQSVDLDAPSRPGTPNRPESVASSKASIMEATLREPPLKPGTPKTSSSQETPSKSTPANLVLPSFGGTYRMKENPSIVKQITSLLLRTRQPPANHVYRAKETPKIKKAIAIGVHGLFPATYLRPMVGQPTGTSLRFANLGAEAIRRWTDAHGCPDCEIEKVALEGDGKIADRVDNLWKLLLNWIDQIRNADLILVASHSQGVPVGVMLLAKLIDLGIITNAKLGVCAMAGVSLGPFPDYKSSMGILMGAANELWEFSNPDSDISKRYEHSLKEVLQYGARITYIGSIDDQLVPMESAVYSPASHPYIYRAVFIDGRIHAPDFIAHLVGFALKLRNLGVSDHGLLRELSTPLAGSLYSGEGHSRLYYDDQVYDLALAHALETSDVRPNPPATVTHRRDANSSLANPNPYHLPWIMRGLLEEDFVRTELSSETEELLRQFDDWKPVTKALKDVKYRLEAIRSKL